VTRNRKKSGYRNVQYVRTDQSRAPTRDRWGGTRDRSDVADGASPTARKIKTRWDVRLHTACSDFAATAHRLGRLSQRITEPDTRDEVRRTLIDQIYDEHANLRSLMEQIWLLSGPDLQRASRMVIRNAVAVRSFAIDGTDPFDQEFGASPQERLSDAIVTFYRSARKQLQVDQPDDLALRDPPRSGY
jgi:hypothetical protein